jgi:hypothetical protein
MEPIPLQDLLNIFRLKNTVSDDVWEGICAGQYRIFPPLRANYLLACGAEGAFLTKMSSIGQFSCGAI